MIIRPETDPLGQAIYNYSFFNDNTPINVLSKVVEDEELPPDYFFRSYNEMPRLERIAIKRCKGKILDIGAGAGCHSVYLQKSGKDVTSLEISKLCCEVLEQRGIKKIINNDILSFSGERFDTILMLMNGIGISKNIAGLKELLFHLKNILQPNGSIIFDSSDLIYLYEEENGSFLLDINAMNYYGEIDYQLKYKDIVGETYSWLFADNVILFEIAENLGYQARIIDYGPHYDYLAELTLL
jgi:SAM-dependent methyltransferase